MYRLLISDSFVARLTDNNTTDDKLFISKLKGKLINSNKKIELINEIKSKIISTTNKKTKAEIMKMLKDVAASENIDADVKKEIETLTGNTGDVNTEQDADTTKTPQTISEKASALRNAGCSFIPTDTSKLSKNEQQAIEILYDLSKTDINLFNYIKNETNRPEIKKHFSLKHLSNFFIKHNGTLNKSNFTNEIYDLLPKQAESETNKILEIKDPAEQKRAIEKFVEKWKDSPALLKKLLDGLMKLRNEGKISESEFQQRCNALKNISDKLDKILNNATRSFKKAAIEKGFYDEKFKKMLASFENTVKTAFLAFNQQVDTAKSSENLFASANGNTMNGSLAEADIRSGFSGSINKYKTIIYETIKKEIEKKEVQQLLATARREIEKIENEFYAKIKTANIEFNKEIDAIKIRAKEQHRKFAAFLLNATRHMKKEEALKFTAKMTEKYLENLKKIYNNSFKYSSIEEILTKLPDALDKASKDIQNSFAGNSSLKKSMKKELTNNVNKITDSKNRPRLEKALADFENNINPIGAAVFIFEQVPKMLYIQDMIKQYTVDSKETSHDNNISIARMLLNSDNEEERKRGAEIIENKYDKIIKDAQEKLQKIKNDKEITGLIVQINDIDNFIAEISDLGKVNMSANKTETLQKIKEETLDNIAEKIAADPRLLNSLSASKLSADIKDKIEQKIAIKLIDKIKEGDIQSLQEMLNSPNATVRNILNNNLPKMIEQTALLNKLNATELVALMELCPDKENMIIEKLAEKDTSKLLALAEKKPSLKNNSVVKNLLRNKETAAA